MLFEKPQFFAQILYTHKRPENTSDTMVTQFFGISPLTNLEGALKLYVNNFLENLMFSF